MVMQCRLSFHVQKVDANMCDFASALSAVEPFIDFINLSNPLSTKIKCIISWSTEEKEDICKKKKRLSIGLACRSQMFSTENIPCLFQFNI